MFPRLCWQHHHCTNFCKQSEFVFWLFSWLLCPLSWCGKEVCDCLWELNGWRTYWHGYCRIKPSAIPVLMTPSLPLSSLSLVLHFPLFLTDGRESSSCRSWVLSSSFSPFSTFFFLSHHISLTSHIFVNISTILFFPSSPHLPIQSQHACVQSALTALASPLADSRTVSCSATRGPVRTREATKLHLVLTVTPRQCIVFLLLEEMLRIVFFHVARKTNSFLCVRIQKGIITTVLGLFFFCTIIYRSEMIFLLTSKVWATETFWAKNNFYAI